MITNRRNLFSDELFEDMLAGGYIRLVQHPTEAGLTLANYTEKAQFEKVWNDCTLACRGLIWDTEGAIVARPYPKFFNWAEKPELISDWEVVQVVDKMDGSLGIAYYALDDRGCPGPLSIATRGSFTSDQAKWASEWMRKTHPDWEPTARITPLFEIIYPQNRIVLDYGDQEGLVMLGGVNMDSGQVLGPHEARVALSWPGEIAEILPYTNFAKFRDSDAAQRKNAEGVVIRSGDKMIKFKQQDYVELHRLVTGLTNRRVWEALSQGRTGDLAGLPDEFHNWARAVADELVQATVDWKRDVVEEFEAIMGTRWAPCSRKEFAEIVQGNPHRAALFKMLDGASIDAMAWAAVKPTEITKPYGGMDA